MDHPFFPPLCEPLWNSGRVTKVSAEENQTMGCIFVLLTGLGLFTLSGNKVW